MVEGTLYLVGITPDGEVVEGVEPCRLCKRVIINAGIKYVTAMKQDGGAKKFVVEGWIDEENLEYVKHTDPTGSTE